ncbi:hypothetical protein H072_8374 [Dactylellina haptotyla CBS 200.50]|uniref:DUF7918 domain-containing protein n=1 Tax=Dactylellina haptotyla (strain CBS 200.50) TaxID=1284197 RepID=S8BF25_DACHA|nr:hypothetical protein H072_8374 [Dactylellina haptotyla CBS 200.50]
MLSSNGVTCELLISNKRAEEYKSENKGSTTKSHVVAIEGRKYVVKLDFSKTGARRHDFTLYADGIELTSMTTTEKKLRIDSIRGKLVNGKGKGKGRGRGKKVENRRLTFGKLGTVDGDAENTELRSNVLNQLGTIKINVHRAKFRARKNKVTGNDRINTAGPVHEESVKGRGLSHITKLGCRQYAKATGSRTTKPIDPENKPYATFIYRYASREILESEGIIELPAPTTIQTVAIITPNISKALEQEAQIVNIKKETADTELVNERDSCKMTLEDLALEIQRLKVELNYNIPIHRETNIGV